MEAITLTVEPRQTTGKGAARQMRAAGRIPAVLYGGKEEAVSLTVSPKDLTAVLSTPYRRNQLIKLVLDGKEQLATVQELQIEPVTRAPLHVDFCRVTVDTQIERLVPFVTKGRAPGVVAGGELRVLYRDVPIKTSPDKIPATIEVSVSKMQVGDAVRVKDLQLPEGVVVALPEERNLVTVTLSRRKARAGDEADAAAG